MIRNTAPNSVINTAQLRADGTSKGTTTLLLGFLTTLITSSCSIQPSKLTSTNQSQDQSPTNTSEVRQDCSKILMMKDRCEELQKFKELPSTFKAYLNQESSLTRDDLITLYTYKKRGVIDIGHNDLAELSDKDFLKLADAMKKTRTGYSGQETAELLLNMPSKDFEKLTTTDIPIENRIEGLLHHIAKFHFGFTSKDIILTYFLRQEFNVNDKESVKLLVDLSNSVPSNWEPTDIKEALKLILKAEPKLKVSPSNTFKDLRQAVTKFSTQFTDLTFTREPSEIFAAMNIFKPDINGQGLEALCQKAQTVNSFFSKMGAEYSTADIKKFFDNLPSYVDKNIQKDTAKESGEALNKLLKYLERRGFKNENLEQLLQRSAPLLTPGNNGNTILPFSAHAKGLETLIRNFDRKKYNNDEIMAVLKDFPSSRKTLNQNLSLPSNTDSEKHFELLKKILDPYSENRGTGVSLAEHEKLKEITSRFVDKSLPPLEQEVSIAEMNQQLIELLDLGKNGNNVIKEITPYIDISNFLGLQYKSFPDLSKGYLLIIGNFINDLPKKTGPENNQESINLKELLSSYEDTFKNSLKDLTAKQRLSNYIRLINSHPELKPSQMLILAQVQESTIFSDIKASNPVHKQELVIERLKNLSLIETTNRQGLNRSSSKYTITNFPDNLPAIIKQGKP